jgi:hypothetical protein
MTTLHRYFEPDILPPHKSFEIDELRQSVKNHGQLRPIITYLGKILDGFKIYEFLLENCQTPKFQEFSNTTISAEEYRLSTSFGRSLTVGQKAALAVRFKEIFEQKNKEKKRAYCKDPNYVAKGMTPETHSDKAAGKLLGVSARSVMEACRLKKVNPDLFKEVADGKLKLYAATAKGPPQSMERSAAMDRIARKVLYESNASSFQPPKNVHESDSKYWELDARMRSKNYSLTLTRLGDTWDAVYTKSYVKPTSGYTSFKAAILGAYNKSAEQ